jgi:chromosome partitioning protein
MHRVITIAGLKGGIGKTSLAASLSAWWSADRRVLLVDADPNASLLKLHQRGDGELLAAGSECVPIPQAPMAMARGWDLILMDTAGGSLDEQRTYAKGSDFVLAPCQVAAGAIEQVLDLADILTEVGARFGVVLTMVDERRRQDADKARALLQGQGFPVLNTQISALSCWPKAEAAGMAVRDARTDSGRPDPGSTRAWQQVAALAAEIEGGMA